MRQRLLALLFYMAFAVPVLALMPIELQASDSPRTRSEVPAALPAPSAQAAAASTSRPPDLMKIPLLSDWQEWLVHGLSNYIGETAASWVLTVLVLLMLAVPFLWSNWDRISRWPTVSNALDWITQPRLPYANSNEFTVLVAKLQADKEGRFENYIVHSLAELPFVRVLRLGRHIRATGADQREAENRALSAANDFLNQTAANILLYGAVIEVNGRGVPKLFWAISESGNLPKRSERYPATGDNRLPQLFWDDLSDVLRLIVVNQIACFEEQRGRFISDKVEPFVARVRMLLDQQAGSAQRWPPDALAAARTAFAVGLFTLG